MIDKMTKDIKPQIDEANEIAKQLNQDIHFDFSLTAAGAQENALNVNQTDDMLSDKKYKLEVKVNNLMTEEMYIWDTKKFVDRLIMMRDLLSSYEDQGQIPEIGAEDDPFVDTPEPTLIGEGYYRLEPLAYLIDNPVVINLIGTTFKVHGQLDVNIVPVGPEGQSVEELPDELIPEEPDELLDQRVDFVIQINQALDLPSNFCRDTYVEYSLFLSEEKHRT